MALKKVKLKNGEVRWRLDYWYRAESPQSDGSVKQKWHRRLKTFETASKAREHLHRTKADINSGDYVDVTEVTTFAEAAELWFDSKKNRRPGTVNNWRRHLDRHLLPLLGKLKLDKIGSATAERVATKLREKNVKPRPVLTTAAAVFAKGVGDKRLSNPFVGVRDPYEPVGDATPGVEVAAVGAKTHLRAVLPSEVLSPDDMAKALRHANPGRDRTMFTLIAATGLREGEAFGLSWTDLDFKDDGTGRLYVRRTLSHIRAHGETATVARFLPPKTKHGRRDFAISRELVSMLKAWKPKCPPSGDLQLVFPDDEGKPIRKEYVLRRAFYPALSRAGLRRVTLHSLRHYFASAMIAAGAPVTEVSARLGHSSPKVTPDVYSHWFTAHDTGTAERVAGVLLNGNRDKIYTSRIETGRIAA